MISLIINLFYHISQWYIVLLFISQTTNQSIAGVHNQIGHFHTLLCIYHIVYKNDYDTAYTIAVSYYIFDIIQMIFLRYRRNLFEHVIFTFHHLATMYVMIFDNYIFRALVYKLELSNLALIFYYYLRNIESYKLYFQIIQFGWYSYFRIFSVIPHTYEILLLKDYEICCACLFYIMGVYWSMVMLYRLIIR